MLEYFYKLDLDDIVWEDDNYHYIFCEEIQFPIHKLV